MVIFLYFLIGLLMLTIILSLFIKLKKEKEDLERMRKLEIFIKETLNHYKEL